MDHTLVPTLGSVLGPVLGRRIIGGGASSLTAQVQALFGKYSAVGGMWKLDDKSTLFQDSAGTTPVTSASQPIGRALDLSGLGNHLAQTASGSRPVFNGDGGTFDGADDRLQTAALNLSGCNKAVVGASCSAAFAHYGTIAALSYSLSAPGNLAIYLSSTNLNHYTNGGTTANGYYAMTLGSTQSLIGVHDHSQPTVDTQIIARNNGVVTPFTASSGTSGTGNFANDSFYVGRSGIDSDPFSGPIRRVVLIGIPVAGVQMSDADVAIINQWLGGSDVFF